jgi:transcriptional regulator with XRE-family HTH domain
MDQLKLFGRRVRAVRKAAKLTQEQAAEKAGITANFLGYVERGTKQPSLNMIFALAKALSVSVETFFRFERAEHDEVALRKRISALVERANLEQLHLTYSFLKYVIEL